jgi:hypothetical protein
MIPKGAVYPERSRMGIWGEDMSRKKQFTPRCVAFAVTESVECIETRVVQ